MRKSKVKKPIYPSDEEKKKRPPREKFNWKPYLIILAVIAVIAGGVFIKVTFVDGYLKLAKQVPFERVDGGYYDAGNDRTYVAAPTYYQASTIVSDPAYARIGDFSLFGIGSWDELDHLYRVGYTVNPGTTSASTILMRSEAWLSTDADHGSILFYNAELFELPQPRDFEFETVYLCDADGNIATQQIDDAASVRIMTDFFSEDSENLYVMMDTLNAKYIKQVRVTSSKYPWMQMVLSLYQSSDAYYLWMPELERFVQTDSTVFDVYFKTAEDLTEEEESQTTETTETTEAAEIGGEVPS
ncbi:MAG: hypothetical protein ACI3YK_07270 [Eubacteriales bacterium]